MVTVTRKQMKTLVMLANRSAKIAKAQETAAKEFIDKFEEIIGIEFTTLPDGAEDQIVDIIDYGNFTDNNDLMTAIAHYCDSANHSVLFE